ncbi:hypothetical protein MPSEU_000409800 [Mayamaea pseudoterrestris]|nr:hypothetical protein MPSEU_000409800 [Mayamaea pseudoterrestris]
MATIQLVKEAILALKDRTGSSNFAISKYIEMEKKVEIKKHILKAALKKGVADGVLVPNKNSYKLSADAKKAKPAAPKKATETLKKAAPKKKAPAAAEKKTTVKKSTTATKKATAPKAAKTVIAKSAAKKPALAKKASAKKPAAKKATVAKKAKPSVTKKAAASPKKKTTTAKAKQ